MKKFILISMTMLMFEALVIAAPLLSHEIVFVDELGNYVTDFTSVTVYDAGTTDTTTIYADRSGGTEITNPVVDTTNYSTGVFKFWSSAVGYKLTVTDGTYSRTVDNIASRNTQLWFPTFLVEMSSYDLTDSQDILMGSDDDWVIDSDTAKRLDFIPAVDDSVFAVGDATYTSDLYWYTGNGAVQIDASGDLMYIDGADLMLKDADILEFGDLAGGDVSMRWDGTDFDVLAATDDSVFNFGTGTNSFDVKIFGNTAPVYALWDASADELLLVTADLKVSQTSQIEFIDATDSLTDWTIDNATDETLLIYPTEVTDDQSINLGNATNTTDLRLFGATASTVVFDASGDEVIFNAYDLSMQDADYIKFGDDDDWTVHSTTTKRLTFTPAGDETYAIDIGADTAGGDLKAFGATTATYLEWDSSADELLLTLADLKLSQGSQLEFIDVTDGLTDWTIDNSTDETLLILPTETTDDQSVNLGNAANTTDLRLFGATASTVVFDASADEVLFDAYDISMGDGDIIRLGDGDDMTMSATGTTTTVTLAAGSDLDILDTDDASSKIILGLTGGTHGLDIQLNTIASGEDIIFDAAAKTLTLDNVDIATGDDDSIIFGDGPDGALQYDEDGLDAMQWSNGDKTAGVAVYGDYKLYVEPTVADDTVTLTALDSGRVLLGTTTAGQGGTRTYDLPGAVAGMYFTFVDISGSGTGTLRINAASGDVITVGAANSTSTVVSKGDLTGLKSITIMSTDSTGWVEVNSGGVNSSTAWIGAGQ